MTGMVDMKGTREGNSGRRLSHVHRLKALSFINYLRFFIFVFSFYPPAARVAIFPLPVVLFRFPPPSHFLPPSPSPLKREYPPEGEATHRARTHRSSATGTARYSLQEIERVRCISGE